MAKEKQPSTVKTISFIFFGAVMSAILVVGMVEADTMRAAWTAEHNKAVDWLGEDAVALIDERTRYWYTAAVVDSGAQRAVYEALIGNWEHRHDAELNDFGYNEWVAGRVEVMWLILGIILYRLVIIATWLPPLLPFLAAVTWDGVCQRQILQNRFHSPSPTLYHAARWYMVILFVGIGVTLLIPATLPAYWVPVAAVFTAGFTWIGITNLRKRL